MSARREEAYYTSAAMKNVLSERTDIINYVPTKGIFAVCGKYKLCRTHVKRTANIHNWMPHRGAA